VKIAVTGATGIVGHAIAGHLSQRGHAVTALGRRRAALPGVAFTQYDMTKASPDLEGFDALVHAAFSHVPGQYRGGEGDDPEGFLRINLEGTLRLFANARDCGVGRMLFLSSRAVYDGYPVGTVLVDGMPARPESLYGRVKAEVEDALASMAGPGLAVASLRATGVYGVAAPGQQDKWADIFAAVERGDVLAPRVGTEVHGDDLAAAANLLLQVEAATLGPVTFNISDILLDRRDLLATYSKVTGRAVSLPTRADDGLVSVMTCNRLRALGWLPRGMDGVRDAIINGVTRTH